MLVLGILGLYFVLWCGVSVDAEATYGHVMNWSNIGSGLYVHTPWIKPDNVVNSATPVELTTPVGEVIRVECKEFNNESPRVYVYTPGGILVDTVVLLNIKDVCTKTSSYMSAGELTLLGQLGDTTEQWVKMTYLMAGKVGRCVERTYKVTEQSYVAVVERFDFPFVECPGLLGTLSTQDILRGGVINLGPTGVSFVTEFIGKDDATSTPIELKFDNDVRGQWFKLVCKKEAAKSGNPNLIGLIKHEKYEKIILEKFVLSDCQNGFMNVNRRMRYSYDYFRVVFKSTDGKCYERDVTIPSKSFKMIHYEVTNVTRGTLRKVRCPKKWTGDVGENVNIPWYLRLFRRKKKYSIDYEPPKKD